MNEQNLSIIELLQRGQIPQVPIDMKITFGWNDIIMLMMGLFLVGLILMITHKAFLK